MKFLRPALIVALLSVVSVGAAFADDIHVIFDPTQATPEQILSGNFGIISSATAVYSVNWESCTVPGPAGIFGPSFDDSNSACIALINQSGQNLNSLTLSLPVTSIIAGESGGVVCTNLDAFLTSNTCDANTQFVLGNIVTFQLFGGNSIPENDAFYIAVMGLPFADGPPPLSVTAPEPTSLTLLAAGMGLLGLGMAFMKRLA
jgi:hypothetical protein